MKLCFIRSSNNAQPSNMIEETSARNEPPTSICIGCGLCCDGTLHGKTTVRPGDQAAVTAIGLEVAGDEGKRFFRQPCLRFSCGTCTVYDRRPGVCRTYNCSLLERVKAEEIAPAAALETIAKAKRLIAAVRAIDRAAVTPAERTELVARLREQLGQREGPSRDAAAKAILDMGVLEYFLKRWFLKPDEREGDL
jgi:Fe-S-cluster containining protein